MVDTPDEIARRPRDRPQRAILAAAAVLPCMAVTYAVRHVVLARTGSELVGYTASIIAPGVLTAWLGPRVSYRARDAWWWIPGFGPYFLALFLWRATLLPYRDWDPRSDETHYGGWISDREYGALWTKDTSP